jgi:hypothetical protein
MKRWFDRISQADSRNAHAKAKVRVVALLIQKGAERLSTHAPGSKKKTAPMSGLESKQRRSD